MPDVSGRHGGSPNTRTEEIPACLHRWTRTSKEVAAESRTHAGLGDRLRFPPYASAIPDAGVAWGDSQRRAFDRRDRARFIDPRTVGPAGDDEPARSAGVPYGREHRPVEVRDIAAGDSGEHESGCEFAAQGMRRTAWCLVDDRCTTPVGRWERSAPFRSSPRLPALDSVGCPGLLCTALVPVVGGRITAHERTRREPCPWAGVRIVRG